MVSALDASAGFVREMANEVPSRPVAGAIFRRLWTRVSEEPTPPEPKDLRHSTMEVLIAATVQGAIFGLVKAGVDRAGARGYHALTREDPS